MAKVAMLTTGPLQYRQDDPRIGSYDVLAEKVFSRLGKDNGFLGLSGFDPGSSWGEWTIPKMYQKAEYDGRILQTLSLWRDLESLHAFSYNGFHAEALKRRDEWFPKIGMPNHVIWWVADEHRPTWAEGAALYDRIATEGASAAAFNFRQLFDANAQPIQLNRELAREKAKHYS